MLYLIVIILLIWLSFRYDIHGKCDNQSCWYYTIMFIFVLVAGLRWRLGVDTPNYLYNFYHEYPTIDKLSISYFSITDSPLFVLLNSVVKTCSGRFYWVQLFHSLVVNVLVFNFVKKKCKYFFTCILFYALICYTGYNMQIMRAAWSICICLYANDYILRKKWIKGYSLYVLALLFHAQTLVWFLLPLFFFLRFNKLGVLACFAAFLLGYIVMNLFGEYMFLLESDEGLQDKVAAYASSDKYGNQSGNINFFLVNIISWLFYVIFSFIWTKRKYPNSDLIKFEPLIVLGVCFIFVRMNLEIAYRYVDYFKLYFCILFAECFISIIKESTLLSKGCAYLKSLVFFLPLLLAIVVYPYFLGNLGFQYFPYSSIIERNVEKSRELRYVEMNEHKSFYPRPNYNEY